MKRRVYVFFGPPGAGKGTLAQFCVQQCGWKHISTGALCRNHIDRGTPLGHMIARDIQAGKLISDEMILSMLEEEFVRLKGEEESLIIDGFPRTAEQAIALDRLLERLHIDSHERCAIIFEASEDVLVKRITSRLVCSDSACARVYNTESALTCCAVCSKALTTRVDVVVETIRKRILTYNSHVQAVASFWQNKKYPIYKINAGRGFENVRTDFFDFCLEPSSSFSGGL